MLLSDINKTACETKNGEAEHEYEMLDKYNQEYEEIKVIPRPQPTQQAGDQYDITQCPAYVPVAHGNQQTETSLVQPTDSTTATKDDVEDNETYCNVAASN